MIKHIFPNIVTLLFAFLSIVILYNVDYVKEFFIYDISTFKDICYYIKDDNKSLNLQYNISTIDEINEYKSTKDLAEVIDFYEKNRGKEKLDSRLLRKKIEIYALNINATENAYNSINKYNRKILFLISLWLIAIAILVLIIIAKTVEEQEKQKPSEEAQSNVKETERNLREAKSNLKAKPKSNKV